MEQQIQEPDWEIPTKLTYNNNSLLPESKSEHSEIITSNKNVVEIENSDKVVNPNVPLGGENDLRRNKREKKPVVKLYLLITYLY